MFITLASWSRITYTSGLRLNSITDVASAFASGSLGQPMNNQQEPPHKQDLNIIVLNFYVFLNNIYFNIYDGIKNGL